MPSTKGLEILIRKNQLTDEEWFGLIEARRELIKPHLDSFTLLELGSLGCLRTELSFLHELRLDSPTLTGSKRFSLKTQGIFGILKVEKTPDSGYGPAACPDGTMLVWGLTRSGLWVLVTISFVGEEGYKERGHERATAVEITEANLPTILAKTKEKPQRIWEQLGEAIKSWVVRRELLHQQALNLARMVEIEELALSLVPEEA